MVDIADLFPGMAAWSDFGWSRGLWIFAKCKPKNKSAQRFFQRNWKTLRQQLRRTIRSNDHQILAAQPEFTRNINSRLIRKRHARFQHGFAAANQVGMLVAIESNSVAQTMRKEFVIGTI